MPERHRHKIGDYLFTDDWTGFKSYRSKMVRQWDGTWIRGNLKEERHPQEFVDALADPIPLKVMRKPARIAAPVAPATTGALLT